jgi:alpha-D-ribose 1-methylphosphonate 5-triphosphate synthase subunit PhnG
MHITNWNDRSESGTTRAMRSLSLAVFARISGNVLQAQDADEEKKKKKAAQLTGETGTGAAPARISGGGARFGNVR